MGFTLAELKEGRFSPADLRGNAGYYCSEMRAAGFTISELKTAGSLATTTGIAPPQRTSTCAALARDAVKHSRKVCCGVAPRALYAGYSGSELRIAGFSASQMREAGFTAKKLKGAGAAAPTMWTLSTRTCAVNHNHTCAITWPCSITATCTAMPILCRFTHARGCQAIPRSSASRPRGVSRSSRRQATRLTSCVRPGGARPSCVRWASPSTSCGMRATRPRSCRRLAVSARRLQRKTSPFVTSCSDARACALMVCCSSPAVRTDTPEELRAAGVKLAELAMAGATVAELKAAGISVIGLKAEGMPLEQLKAAGYKLIEFKAAGYTTAELRSVGYEAAELMTVSIGVKELRANGYTANDLSAAGVTVLELKEAVCCCDNPLCSH